MAKYFKKA